MSFRGGREIRRLPVFRGRFHPASLTRRTDRSGLDTSRLHASDLGERASACIPCHIAEDCIPCHIG
ncbi:hypothetical protein GCM10012289_23310 [Nonomuraea cavernae]|uniref:Uncharacterized protein n=1 Tax=Nonomuraea cavernae TaxID=2045107 RepID=A0A917YV60_9ACTN|nr:hypothetical protein GCM10012289_23310 [Nonomuraea cavernae]